MDRRKFLTISVAGPLLAASSSTGEAPEPTEDEDQVWDRSDDLRGVIIDFSDGFSLTFDSHGALSRVEYKATKKKG